MAGGTIIVPLIMGFDPNLALLFTGVGTLIFFVVVAGRVPSYLGSSFSFVVVVIAASGYSGHGPNPDLDVALGAIIAAGMLYGVIVLIVTQSGVGWVERLMPPVVTGAVVAAIGLNLAPVAVKSVTDSQFDTWIGLLTVLIIGLIAVSAPGLWRRLPIVFGAIGGYSLYLLLANGFGLGKSIDFTALGAAPWPGLPKFTGPSFHADAMFLIAPVAIILVAENLGHIKAVGVMTGRSLRDQPSELRWVENRCDVINVVPLIDKQPADPARAHRRELGGNHLDMPVHREQGARIELTKRAETEARI